jgi:hypothetical protein
MPGNPFSEHLPPRMQVSEASNFAIAFELRTQNMLLWQQLSLEGGHWATHQKRSDIADRLGIKKEEGYE